MKIVLLFPPAGNPSQPYVSLPSLTAYMRRAGHTVIQRDLAVEAIADLINARRLRQSMECVAARLAHLTAQSQQTAGQEAERYHLGRVSTYAPYVVEQIEKAKHVLRDPSLILTRHPWALQVVGLGLELFSAEFWPSVWTMASYAMPDYGINVLDMMAASKDREQNLFFDYFEQQIVPSILAEEPDLVGISCSYNAQILATLSLAHLLKQARPDLHICVGGAVIAHLAPVLKNEPAVFSLVNSFATGEGECTLLCLTEALSGDGDLSQVPNLMYLDDGEVRTTIFHMEDVNTLPSPDYEGLPLNLYLTPEINVLLVTDRGCYWHRCSFCVLSTAMHHRYRPRRMSLVIEDMKALHRQLGTRCFFLSNDAIPPKRMAALARAIRDEELDFLWQTETRLEKSLTPELCHLLVEGGCRRLAVGIEAGSQHILDLVNKGTRAADLPRLLHNCHQAGIAMHTFLMVGFPTETREEARETIAFVENNYEAISSLTFQVFSLYPDSKVHADPESYGISGWTPADPRCLDRTVQSFEITLGMRQEEIMHELLPEARRRFAARYPSVRLIGKVIHACLIPALGGLDRGYLSWLAHTGLRHFREAPEVASDTQAVPDLEDISDQRLALVDGVCWRNGNGSALTLFNPRNARVLSLPPHSETLLQQCDGRSTVRQIANRLAAQRHGVDQLSHYYQTLKLSRRLVEEGFLAVSCHEGGDT